MASGIGNLPNPSMAFSPFDILTAEEMNNLVENIEALATGTGIGDGAIPTAAYGDLSITYGKIDLSTFSAVKTTDANGWTKIDMGGFLIYRKRVTFSQSFNVVPAGTAITLSSSNLPVGVANISSVNMQVTYSITNGSAYNINIVPEMQTNATALNFTGAKLSGSAGTASGFIEVVIVD